MQGVGRPRGKGSSWEEAVAAGWPTQHKGEASGPEAGHRSWSGTAQGSNPAWPRQNERRLRQMTKRPKPTTTGGREQRVKLLAPVAYAWHPDNSGRGHAGSADTLRKETGNESKL